MTDTTRPGDRVERPADAPDMTHLGGRTARSADAPDDGTVHPGNWGGARLPAHFPKLLNAVAGQYADMVAKGGTDGAAHAFLNNLRQEAQPWADPWRLLEAVAGRLAQKIG